MCRTPDPRGAIWLADDVSPLADGKGHGCQAEQGHHAYENSPDELAPGLDDEGRLVTELGMNYLHLPVQSGSSAVLERMRRGYDRQTYLSKIEALRERMPEMLFGTDIIVGFPGETEEEFEQMFDHTLWREMREKYDANGAFPTIYEKVKPETDPLAFLAEEESWQKAYSSSPKYAMYSSNGSRSRTGSMPKSSGV